MQTRIRHNLEKQEAKTGGIDEACARYGLGKASMRKVAEDAGAVIRIGKRYLVNYSKVDVYYEQHFAVSKGSAEVDWMPDTGKPSPESLF